MLLRKFLGVSPRRSLVPTSQVGNIQNSPLLARGTHARLRQRHDLSRIRRHYSLAQRNSNNIHGSNVTATDMLKRVTVVCAIEQMGARFAPSRCDWNDPIAIDGSNTSSLTRMNGPSLDPSYNSNSWEELRRKASHALRLFARVVKLLAAVAPLVALYPLQRLTYKKDVTAGTNADAHDTFLASLEERKDEQSGWYFRLCLYSVECSGAAVIKLMQWASSRPDLFGKDFCRAFSKLQDDTTPHAIRHTEEILRQAYGDDWEERIRLDPKVVGSGCIGQVYKGIIQDLDGKEQQVAVKVMHPNVSDAIGDDLNLLRLFVQIAQRLPFDVFATLRWMNPEGVIEEFADLLQLQLDLRTEANNLERFHENFKHDERVAFPRLIKGFEPHSQVLIETFCEGVPVLKFIKEHRNDQKLLSEMCLVGIRTVCQMLFLDNFMHGDLHPGNVFINAKDRKFVLLDAGIATEYSDSDHELIVNVLSSFIRQDGRKAGRLMIDDSNVRATQDDKAINETLYIDKIQALTDRANSEDYFMEHLAVYLTYICESAAKHHVMMNQKFITAALSIQVLEGMSLALDPTIEIWRVANPVILKAELIRRWSQASQALVDTLGVTDFMHKNFA